MSKLTWDSTGEHFYETGIEKCALFPITSGKYATGVAWNGITSINENSSGGEITALYADNIKYLQMISPEEFAATVEAYAYPEEFKQCIGELGWADGVVLSQQRRKHFGLVYRTLIGNDIYGSDLGYKLHILFDCIAGPTAESHSTITDSPEAMTFSWEINTNKESVDDYLPTACVVMDSLQLKEVGLTNILTYIEDMVYGSDSNDPTFMGVSDILDACTTQMYIMDLESDFILDSDGNYIQSSVY
ncbi:MAG: hypothetical protein LUE29_09820 [Lachnospiraceae bacterium]|nr:hypothetical protein [Lachnospiraceae bacterium]